MRLLFYPGLDGREVDELMPGIGDHTGESTLPLHPPFRVSGGAHPLRSFTPVR